MVFFSIEKYCRVYFIYHRNHKWTLMSSISVFGNKIWLFLWGKSGLHLVTKNGNRACAHILRENCFTTMGLKICKITENSKRDREGEGIKQKAKNSLRKKQFVPVKPLILWKPQKPNTGHLKWDSIFKRISKCPIF